MTLKHIALCYSVSTIKVVYCYNRKSWMSSNPPPNFINRETEAQKSKVTSLRSYGTISIVSRLYILMANPTIRSTEKIPRASLLPIPTLSPGPGIHWFALCRCSTSCIWVHRKWTLLGLPSFIWHNFQRFSHVVAGIRSSFLLLSSILLYYYTTIYLFICW